MVFGHLPEPVPDGGLGVYTSKAIPIRRNALYLSYIFHGLASVKSIFLLKKRQHIHHQVVTTTRWVVGLYDPCCQWYRKQ